MVDTVFYHAPCPDGFGAAWSVRHKYPDATFIPLAYGQDVDPSLYKNKDVLMIDVALDEPVMDDICLQSKSFLGLDHHKTAFDRLGDKSYMRFDMKKSGAGLAWDEIIGSSRPFLIDLVEDRDLWKWKIDGSRDYLMALDCLPLDFDAWTEFAKRLDDPLSREQVLKEGQAISKFFNMQLEKIAPHASDMEDQGLSGSFINVPYLLASDMGSYLCKAHQKDFAFTWFLRNDGQVQASWRSETVDIIHLAERFGGGGHKRACGARMTLDDLRAYIEQSPKSTPSLRV